jgi:hypothetical protein
VHPLDHATDYRPADTPVFARARGAWRAGRVVAWHRTPAGWIAQVTWRTGPPVYSSCVDFLPADQLRDAETCLHCQVASTRWIRHLAPIA